MLVTVWPASPVLCEHLAASIEHIIGAVLAPPCFSLNAWSRLLRVLCTIYLGIQVFSFARDPRALKFPKDKGGSDSQFLAETSTSPTISFTNDAQENPFHQDMFEQKSIGQASAGNFIMR